MDGRDKVCRRNTKRRTAIKKFLCLALAGLMLLSLVSCGEITPPEGTGPNGNNQETDTSDELYQCDLPDDLDYGGETVNILYAKVTGRDDELVDEAPAAWCPTLSTRETSW